MIQDGRIFVAMPPLYRIDVGIKIYYSHTGELRQRILAHLMADGLKGRISETRFKGLGEMSPRQLRETTIDPDTRRLLQLTVDDQKATDEMMSMLLGRKRAADRRSWLEERGNLAETGESVS